MKELKKVGIFHSNPISAARHMNQIWDSIDEWWNDPIVIKAKESYCRKYAYSDKNLLCNFYKSTIAIDE